MAAVQEVKSRRLLRKELRVIEAEFGVFLDQPHRQLHVTQQQFGVYDGGDHHLGDVMSVGDFHFTEDGLRKVLRTLLS